MAQAGAENAPVHREKTHQKSVFVYDCRPDSSAAEARAIDITSMDHSAFLQAVMREFSLSTKETFVISTTDRRQINEELYEELMDGRTLHLLMSLDQKLSLATQERIEYLPHYHTLVQCGMYEYYASEGQKALPYAFAELIDNALSATANNTGKRIIEIRLLFDEAQGGPAVVVMDNGCGMTSKQLNNWAVYRLSKFIRDSRVFEGDQTGYVRPKAVPRSLNSDISYFGVGGKQAVFYIGQCVRMISKPTGSPDVHEFVMSKEDFERKEKNREGIYSGFIRNRKPGDCTHLNVSEEQFLQSIVLEEEGKESFTAVVITGAQAEHVTYLKQNFNLWTRELAHTYHYYIHGIDGNDMKKPHISGSVSCIDIQISMFERSTRVPRVMNLREVDNDMQTLYVKSSMSTFEFKATGAGDSLVEGIIRYHPFLYDRETYPVDPYAKAAPAEDEDEDCFVLNPEGRGKRPIFECFWNGRLIPYTSVSEFEWCARPKKTGTVPLECYNRISGVLFANDRFQVSTNKLTFMDLELQLRDKNTIFTRVHNGQEQRVKIQREFINWLKECHGEFDKQVMFQGFQGVTTRTDVTTKHLQFPWATFTSIKWDRRTYEKKEYVKSIRTQPIMFGSIVQFLLHGHHEGDVYATEGHVQIALEPKELYGEEKIIPISKIDRLAAPADIKMHIENELDKLPDRLRLTWPDGNQAMWFDKDIRPAGTPMGPIKVEILNKKEETMSRLPTVKNTKKLSVKLEVTWHSPNGDVQTNCYISVHSPKWEYWFKKMENLSKLGKYTLLLQTIISDSSANEWAGKRLPHHTLKFTIKEGEAVAFSLGAIPSPVQIGVPFSIPLNFRDGFDYPTQPPADMKPQLECSSLELSFDEMAFGTTCVMKDVRARGNLSQHNKMHTVKIHVPGLKQNVQSFQITVQPGPPHTLVVLPDDDDDVSVENGTPANIRVEVHDDYHNITNHPKLTIRCQLLGAPDVPVDVVDCSHTGSGLMLTKPLQLKNIHAQQIYTAKFNIPNHKAVACVERKLRVLPSTRVSRLEVYRQDEGSDVMVLQNLERIDWTAGDTLGSLYFRLYDEGDRLVSLPLKLASKIKVNWSAEMNAEELSNGKLPPLSVPTQAQRDHFCSVSFHDQHTVSTSFIIVTRPDEPENLRVTVSESTVQMGKILSGNIYVDVIDQFGNKTDSLNAESVKGLTVSADDLDQAVIDWQASTAQLSVRGVRFASGPPGPRELCFRYQNMETFIRIKVTAGPPKQVVLLDKPEMPVQVLNDQGLDTPFTLQLCDEWGNPSPDQRISIVIKTLSAQLKVKSSVSSQPVDAEGKASFIFEKISGPKGEHQLEFRGSFSRNFIQGPVVTLNVIPDPNKPFRLYVDFDRSATLCAGDVLPVFTVSVFSEVESLVRNICPANLSMLLWRGSAAGSRPSSDASTLKCSKQDDGYFCFRDKPIPELAGKYVIQFVLAVDKTKHLWSQQIPIHVVPNKPVKLAPEVPPSTPVVSNGQIRLNRTLLNSLCLKIMDNYNNAAGDGLDGQVFVTITGTGDIEVPRFDNGEKSVSFSLNNGEAHITDLAILENSPGVDGAEYILRFNSELKMSDAIITSYSLAFRFCNDAERQKVLSTLSKRKDGLSQTILMYKDIFDTHKQLVSELESQVAASSKKLFELNSEMTRNELNIKELTSATAIENAINVKKVFLTKMDNQPRRKCTIPDPFKGRPDVLGKVGHLAQIEDDDVAKVISWHLLGDMDCVVTETTDAAKRIYNDTQGHQQVIPLETVFWKPSNRPLPHIRNGSPLFSPVGNPAFVKDLLIFPQHAESCSKVFASLVGDTILVNDLDSANHYRKGVVQNKMQCPTILTRQGERIRSNGKFGGLQNKAPSIEKLRGQVFGAPLPKDYNNIQTQIELLQQYLVATQKAANFQSEYTSRLQHLQSPEMMKKEQELMQQEDELRDIEKRIASTSEHVSSPVTVKRSLKPETTELPTPAKRSRRGTRKLDE